MGKRICPLFEMAQLQPNQIAIDAPGYQLTYKELNFALFHHTIALQKQSVIPSSRIAFIATSSLHTILLFFSLFRLCATACPLSIRTPKPQLFQLAQECGAEQILDPNTLPIQTTPASFKTPNCDLNEIATILMTSGSSGKPKAACLTLSNHFASAEGCLAALECTPSTRYHLSLPLFHVGGLAILFRTFLAGGTLVLSDLPLFTALCQKKITHASFVPTQLFRFLQEDPDTIQQAAKQLQCILVGGAPLSTSLAQKALQQSLPIHPTYGMTEMGSMITLAKPHEIHTHLHMGKPLKNRLLSLRGEILVRGATLFSGYWDPIAHQLNSSTTDGWFATKDIGKLDEMGNLILLGRKDRMFISGGENIQPEEIEAALCQIPGIFAAHVVPIDDLEFGKRPIAYLLEEKPTHTLDSIRQALSSHLASFKHPVQIFPYSQQAQTSAKQNI